MCNIGANIDIQHCLLATLRALGAYNHKIFIAQDGLKRKTLSSSEWCGRAARHVALPFPGHFLIMLNSRWNTEHRAETGVLLVLSDMQILPFPGPEFVIVRAVDKIGCIII